MAIHFIDAEHCLVIHDLLIKLHGGSYGVRDTGLLDSALHVPLSGYGESYFHEDLYEMAAAYAFHLIKNHPFVDGNKRTGIATMIVFLKMNDVQVNLSNRECIKLGVDIAVSKLSKSQIAEILRKHTILV